MGRSSGPARMMDGRLARSEGYGLPEARGAKGSALIAGEEARSRQAGENAEMAARHLVPFGAALRACDPVSTSCGYEREFHGALCLWG
jgi:hypothetical protein